jgi:uncharacterized protein YbjQ (UPF0145 family)
MTEWDGRGLPPAATARVRRAAETGVRSSLLSAPAAAALARIGLEPVGEVMGCVVMHLGWSGWGCSAYNSWGGGLNNIGYVPPEFSGQGSGAYQPYVQAVYNGYEQSLRRLLLEAQALGADGAVGIRWTQQSLDHLGNREFVAIGTAVRARAETRPAHLFATDLPGEDVAKLMLSGWMPVGLAIGVSVGIKHDDYYTRSQASSFYTSNREVVGFTELVHGVRSDARAQFARRASRQGGDSSIVSRISLDTWESENNGHRDHLAQCFATGTTLATFDSRDRPAAAATLTVLPLTTTDRGSRR